LAGQTQSGKSDGSHGVGVSVMGREMTSILANTTVLNRMTKGRLILLVGIIALGICFVLGATRVTQRGNCQAPLFVRSASVLPIGALIQQAGGLPKSSVEVQSGPALPASVRIYPVANWEFKRVSVGDDRPLWESIRDDDPTYSVEMEFQIRYADGSESILRWKTWRYGLVLCPLVLGYGDGPPGRIEIVDR